MNEVITGDETNTCISCCNCVQWKIPVLLAALNHVSVSWLKGQTFCLELACSPCSCFFKKLWFHSARLIGGIILT